MIPRESYFPPYFIRVLFPGCPRPGASGKWWGCSYTSPVNAVLTALPQRSSRPGLTHGAPRPLPSHPPAAAQYSFNPSETHLIRKRGLWVSRKKQMIQLRWDFIFESINTGVTCWVKAFLEIYNPKVFPLSPCEMKFEPSSP